MPRLSHLVHRWNLLSGRLDTLPSGDTLNTSKACSMPQNGSTGFCYVVTLSRAWLMNGRSILWSKCYGVTFESMSVGMAPPYPLSRKTFVCPQVYTNVLHKRHTTLARSRIVTTWNRLLTWAWDPYIMAQVIRWVGYPHMNPKQKITFAQPTA